MKIAGFQKSSFVDFPGLMAAVIFTPGCNMRCGYCHNKHILSSDAPSVDPILVMDYLNKRKNMLKGVVVSGGEPTLQHDLGGFLASLKGLGYKVKLDTNGTHPSVVKSLSEKGLIDYVAMDIKAPKEKYTLVSGRVDWDNITETASFLRSCGIDHEFRTTFCPELTGNDIAEISKTVVGNSNYYLQQYRQVEGHGLPYPKEYVERAAETVRAHGGKCVVRGL